MKRLNSALVALSVPMIALAVGCGDAGGGSTSAKADTSASAKPGSSSKTAANSAAPAASGAPSAAAKQGGDTASPTTADVGATIKYMPKSCESVRAFVNTGELLSGELGKNLDAMKGKIMGEMGGKAEGDKAKKVDEALTASGFTMSAVRELSVCMGKDKKGIVAVGFDTSGLKGGLADALSKAIEAGMGKAPEKKDEDGVTYLTGEKKDEVMAVKGNVLLVGDGIDALKAAAKGAGEGAADFGDAAKHVVWAKGEKDGEAFQANVMAAGDNYDVKVMMPPPKAQAAEFKADSKKAIEKMQAEVTKGAEEMEKQPQLKPLEPAVKNLKLAFENDQIVATTSFPKKALADLLSEVLKDPKMLGGMMH